MKRLFIGLLCCLSVVCGAYTQEVLSTKARVILLKNFLTNEECDYIIRMAKPELKRSTVVDETGASVSGKVDYRRTSEGMFFPILPDDPVLRSIEKRVADLTHSPVENGEAIQVLCYQKGGEYQPHFDYFNAATAGGADTLKRGGQRVATVIMYLNTPEEGGETIFPSIGASVTPKKGNAVLFYDCTPEGKEDPLTFHGGSPVIKGEKWIATKWVRQSTFH